VTSDPVERRLAAILSADAVGYSRLMAEDEAGTIRTLTSYRHEIAGLVGDHRGRVVDSPGDNVLVEFRTAIDAVECAVEIQRVLDARNSSLPAQRRMDFRVGVHLGDIAFDAEHVYGDGVNIAARLESLADAGGICISGAVYEQVANKLALAYDDLGQKTVKNIPKPVRVYRVRLEEAQAKSKTPTPRHRSSAKVAVACATAVGALVVVVSWLNREAETPSGEQSASATSQVAVTAPHSSGRPGIAVLPFCNLSGDPEQEYFSDGVTEDLTAVLATSPDLLVISRSSAARYECQPPDLKKVGHELGARYLIEGSVRRAQDRVRITAQLIDATTDVHVWSESYERDLTPANVFAIQSDIARQISNALQLQIFEWEGQRRNANPTAWDLFMRARYRTNRITNQAELIETRQWLLRAIELDPDFAPAYRGVAGTYFSEFLYGWNSDPKLFDRAEGYARKSLALDPRNAHGHDGLANVLEYQGKYAQAIREARQAIELNPSLDSAYTTLASSQMHLGQLEEAERSLEILRNLNPRYPSVPFWALQGRLHYLRGEYDEAITAWERVRAMSPLVGAVRVVLVYCYATLGRDSQARAIAQEILSVRPEMTVAMAHQVLARLWNPEWIPPDLDARLLAAGLPSAADVSTRSGT
jgi:adenylate cyclase